MSQPTIHPHGPPHALLPWAQVWHLPVLLMGLGLFTVGLWMIKPATPVDEFPAALDSVEKYLLAKAYDQAETMLRRIEPRIGEAKRQQQAHYQMLWADVIFLQQQEAGGDLAENHTRVVRHYERGRELGGRLDGVRRQRLAETLVSLGRDNEALALLEQMQDEPARRRYQVIKQMIERQQQRSGGVSPQELRPLIAEFLRELDQESDAAVRLREEVWAVAMQARVLLDVNEPEAAVDYLLRMIKRLERPGSDKTLLPLRLLLARGNQILGNFQLAREGYLHVQARLDPPDPLNADVLVGLGQLDLAETGDVHAALGHFTQAETNYAQTNPARAGFVVYLDALIGRGDAEAKLDAPAQAVEMFDRAVQLMVRYPRGTAGRVEKLVDVTRSHYEAAMDREDYEQALRYLRVLKPLPAMPTDMLVEFAVVHQRIAEDRKRLASESQVDGRELTVESRRLLNQEAAEHFAAAADHYRRHAQAVTITQDQAHGMSLWNAAINYDHAQLWKEAIDTYAEFVRTRPSDPRHLEAINRLGKAYMADGQYRAAADLFNRLVEEHPRNSWTYESLVPLARSLIALGDMDAALRTLTFVVSEHPAITPESQQYRAALIELGRLHYRQKQFAEAIARLDEAVQRYGDHPDGAVLRFLLADAMRQSIGELDRELAQPLPQSRRVALQTERARRLEQGHILYSQVISDLESRSSTALSDIERLYLRNSYFYRADCAYDLGRYEIAIELYDIAAKRYDGHPASLVALVQSVNAYSELGNVQAAAAMNNRARDQLKRIPDEAFDDPNLPMQREHWQRWLQFTSELDLLSSRANADRDG